MESTVYQGQPASPARKGIPDIIALAGGKGGVGKTSVAVNLGLTLARRGHKVLLLDADTDLANVSILLGQYPSRTLEQVMTGECRIGEVIMEASYGLHVIPGASGVERCMTMGPKDSLSALRQLSQIEKNYDTILIDTASGLQPTSLHMIAAAMMACVIITPDPASLTDAFSLLRVLRRRGYSRTPGVVVNMASGPSQSQSVYRRFSSAVRRHLDVDTAYVGAVWRDETIRQSVELQRPVALLGEADPSCRQFMTLAEQLSLHLKRIPARNAGLAAYWHHRAKTRQADEEGEPAGLEVTREFPKPPPVEQGRALFKQLEQLLVHNPGDPLLLSEALRGASALLLRMAEDTGSAGAGGETGPAYDAALFGSQESLVEHLNRLPEGMTVNQFLSSLARDCD